MVMKQPTHLFIMVLSVGLLSGVAVARVEESDASGNLQTTTTKTVETFIPAHRAPVASLELQPEIIVVGGEVTLNQICKWSDGDADMMAEYANLIVMRIEPGTAYATLSVEQIQSILRDAGLNPASVNFAGAATCRVARGDVNVDRKSVV